MNIKKPSRLQTWISAVARAYVNYLPHWRGKLRLLRLFRGLLVVQVRPDVWIQVDPRVEIEASFLETKLRFVGEEVEFLWHLLQPGMTVVDIGAFVGVMSLVAARRVGPHGRVVAFEPGSHSIVRFVANRQLNMANNVVIVAAAAGDRYGSIPYYYQHACPDQSSVGYRRETTTYPIIVPVMPLDEVLGEIEVAHVDLMKIDVEGAEPSVIAGAKRILSGSRAPILMIEINPGALRWAGNSVPDLVDAISALGYELWVLEVAQSEKYVNVVGIKPEHREKFPNLADSALSPLLTHDWYQRRIPGDALNRDAI